MVVFYLKISKILTFFTDFDKKMLGRMLLLSSGAKRNQPINSVWPYLNVAWLRDHPTLSHDTNIVRK